MTFRIKTELFKNVMGTMFLLAAAFFVCSTLVSMRSVFADPIAPAITASQTTGRASPRTTARTTNRTVSRSVASRGTVANKSVMNTAASRSVGTRKVSSRSITPTRSTNSARGVTARSTQNKSARNDSARTVRSRTASTQSRVSTSGTVMAGTRAGTSITYSYLANKLYTGTYSDIIDSSTGLISADAYANCMESYYTCMDEICTARSDTKGRCSCAGRAVNFLATEDALETANEELIKLSGQLSLLIATKGKGEDLASAFTLTEAEQVMNCVSWKDLVAQYGSNYNVTEVKDWCNSHGMYTSSDCKQPSYCTNNNYGFDISNINGSSSDILAQLQAWAKAKDLAKQYTDTDANNLINKYTTISGVVDALSGITEDVDSNKAKLDSLANKWGYDLFQYAHNNVCGRVLDSCFNGIYEACGTPTSITEDNKTVRVKCGNGATSSCPFNYNSYVSVEKSGDTYTGELVLSDSTNTSAKLESMSSCFGYSSTTDSSSRTGKVTSTDPYYSLRGPVANARKSIIQKYLLDANAACDTYGASLKQTAQNINYQKIAAEQALQQKRLEFKQEADEQALADAKTAIDNFNECISEIWDCYEQYEDEDKWTTARIKAYCSQVAQVPHCYEPMICSPLQTQLTAVVDMPDSANCKLSNDYTETTCRNVVTISEILYGTGSDASNAVINWDGTGSVNGVKSAGVREMCLQRSLGCGKYAGEAGNSETTYCLRKWNKTDKGQTTTSVTTIADSDTYSSYKNCTAVQLSAIEHAEAGYIIDGNCKVTKCESNFVPNYYATACTCPANLPMVDSVANKCVAETVSCTSSELPANAAKGTKIWNTANNAYGACVVSSCLNGYTLENGVCVEEE